MNPLLQNTQSQPSMNNILDFARNTTPDAAKAQLDQMLASGAISQQQLDQLKQQAQNIAQMLGIL